MLIRVFEIPFAPNDYCFAGGKPTVINELDWFTDEAYSNPTKEDVIEFIRTKRYNRGQPLLILWGVETFTMNWDGAFE